MRFCILGSGSGGNACYFETENARLLIDAGFSAREIVRRLDWLGIPAESLNGIVITHEHRDHIRGAGPLSRRFHLPLYLNRRTHEKGGKLLGAVARTVIIETGRTLIVEDLNVETFTKCHDAADPLGLVVSNNGVRVGFVTDLGRSTKLVEDRLKGCQALIMEFNYDPQMLENGPYPLELKRRIHGPDGHFSNADAGNLVRTVSGPGTRFVVLAHLSETNNHPKKALEEAQRVLEDCGLNQATALLCRQELPGPMLELMAVE